MAIHKNIYINADQVVDEFASKNRNLHF
nr:unnamed protein product [Callosobruchus chinensis]